MKVTDAAIEYIKTLLEKNNAKAFRLSIKKTGCSGYAYQPELVNDISSTDEHFDVKDMVILVDVLWLHLLKDIEIDYVEENKSGLKQKRLVFINPNESGRCGCGESFHAS